MDRFSSPLCCPGRTSYDVGLGGIIPEPRNLAIQSSLCFSRSCIIWPRSRNTAAMPYSPTRLANVFNGSSPSIGFSGGGFSLMVTFIRSILCVPQNLQNLRRLPLIHDQIHHSRPRHPGRTLYPRDPLTKAAVAASHSVVWTVAHPRNGVYSLGMVCRLA